ncbi:hypothetical protein ATPR_3178 [Acetobacter tropicalis NBRC 101654]|uniref:Uncharacterized protein n=1 Tax=Acetobacter tropicalis NBRC 101654 TaxID=749388 RepID=F7VIH9_9PROT|nr:hypothetical protein ATPR_3178 [Acetobacter tropicalis NBRC 101654]
MRVRVNRKNALDQGLSVPSSCALWLLENMLEDTHDAPTGVQATSLTYMDEQAARFFTCCPILSENRA